MNFTQLKKQNSSLRTRCFELSECLAKTYQDGDGSNIPGRDVFSHCLIVGHIARSLLSRMPTWLKGSLYPLHSELIAASHDVGKVCPTFQEKIRRGRNNSSDYQPNSYPGLEGIDPAWEERWGYHAGLSLVTLSHCKVGKFIPEIVGEHHGYSPPKEQVEICSATAERYGGCCWQKLRENLIENLKSSLKANWPVVENDKQAMLIAGLTTVSDWIGSTSRFDDPKNERWEIEIENAIDEAGFFPIEIKKGLTFQEIFLCNPRPIQQNLIDACQTPGVYILEAPMGIGKTEAALYASYKLLESEQASGIYFALPTQLTSDKIYERVNKFLDKILPQHAPNRKAVLAHANAKLKLMDLGEEGSPGGSWFSGHKRELLATFGVGTVDQALMSVLNVKHGFIRSFGLAGKVVILDEIHSYDAYTGTVIDVLIEHLVSWKCTVIILSATLTKDRRQKLLNTSSLKVDNHYPLISIKTEKEFSEIQVTPDLDSKVKIERCDNIRSAIDEVLSRAEKGQQILWIENTVQEAQEIYKMLKVATAFECSIKFGLLHSRFIRAHREQIEFDWIDLYGKDGGEKRLSEGRILVGTQILEQSLDIDADFLVTRLCPTDMLFQRLGRLWRHKGLIRAPSAKQKEAWILSPDLKSGLENPKMELGKSYYVYSPYYLLRTLELLMEFSGKFLSLPSHIRQLIESTYQERIDTGIMNRLKHELERKKTELQNHARIGLSKGFITQSDDFASTRYSEQETCEVLIIQKIKKESGGVSLTLINGETLFLPSKPNLKNRKELSLQLHKYIVKVTEDKAPSPQTLNDLDWIKNYLYVGNQEKNTLRVVKLTSREELLSLNNASFPKKLNYNSTLGYYNEE